MYILYLRKRMEIWPKNGDLIQIRMRVDEISVRFLMFMISCSCKYVSLFSKLSNKLVNTILKADISIKPNQTKPWVLGKALNSIYQPGISSPDWVVGFQPGYEFNFDIWQCILLNVKFQTLVSHHLKCFHVVFTISSFVVKPASVSFYLFISYRYVNIQLPWDEYGRRIFG